MTATATLDRLQKKITAALMPYSILGTTTKTDAITACANMVGSILREIEDDPAIVDLRDQYAFPIMVGAHPDDDENEIFSSLEEAVRNVDADDPIYHRRVSEWQVVER